jgi:transcriptional regulator with XRE-family HTH domain
MTSAVPERPSELLAAYIRKLRDERGWTAEGIAARCAKAGAPEITRSVIANIETGRRDAAGWRRRDVTVDELVTLAAVLEMPAGALLALALGHATEVVSTELRISRIRDRDARLLLRKAASDATSGGTVWLVRADGTRVAALVSAERGSRS